MSDTALPSSTPAGRRTGLRARLNRLAASRAFQSWAAGKPILRRIARNEGDALFDLVAGFAHSQVLAALVDLRLLHLLMDRPVTPVEAASLAGLPPDRMRVLLRAGAALGLLRRDRDGRYMTSQRGAALTGVPGLEAMIAHHRVLYRDLADPVAFFRGEGETELARFWPYVFGADGASDPEVTRRYSALMADSQVLVAEDTLRTDPFRGVTHLMDVGGGSGVFALAAAAACPGLRVTVLDLPEVVRGAADRIERAGQSDRIGTHAASFRDDPLPPGADAISLIRVLYDHGDDTVRALLPKVRDALPPGGRVVVSEPMTGGDRPERAGDAYFALYTLAMGTGRARSAAEIAALLREAGFQDIRTPRPGRPFVTRVVSARRPA